MKIEAIPALEDNYIWMMQEGEQAILVDPGESEPAIDVLEEKALDLVAVLLTHNHDDHTGGVEDLKKIKPDLPVYGPKETEEYADHQLEEGDTLSVLGHTARVYATPSHTHGHISYLLENNLFCGDALFSAGCGRVFTGDYEAQYETLQWMKSLADEVEVYPAHEYTLTNLKFAESVKPQDKKIRKALEEALEHQKQSTPTLPSTIGREKEINVFLQAENLGDFIELRERRDEF